MNCKINLRVLILLETALKKGGNKNYTVKAMPGLNHLFQTAKTGLPSEYGTIEKTFAPVLCRPSLTGS